MRGGEGAGRDGGKNIKPIPAPPRPASSRGAGTKYCPIPAPPPLRVGENPHGAGWDEVGQSGTGKNCHPSSRNNCLEELMIDSGPLLKSLYLKSGSLLTTLPLSHCTYPIAVILSSHFLYTSSQSFVFFESRLVAKWSPFQFWRDIT